MRTLYYNLSGYTSRVSNYDRGIWAQNFGHKFARSSFDFLPFRCRSRNRLAYLRKTCSGYETTAETSEHPLIYDDANINFVNGIRTQPRIPIAHVNSYQLESRANPQVKKYSSLERVSLLEVRSLCISPYWNGPAYLRYDHCGLFLTGTGQLTSGWTGVTWEREIVKELKVFYLYYRALLGTLYLDESLACITWSGGPPRSLCLNRYDPA